MSDGARDYITTITGVREVVLVGTAELAYWREQLRRERLAPFDNNGRAALQLAAIDSKFRGIPFRELSISVLVSEDGGATAGGAYLIHAYNSSRLLALAERVFFQTPYHLAHLTVEERIPARIEVARGGRAQFAARMGSERPPARREDVLFDGPIYLPGGANVFYARLSGAADVFPIETTDVVTTAADSAEPAFERLLASGFAGTEWLVRPVAAHARTKTYSRS